MRAAPPLAFFFLHLCTAWPIGVVGLALGNALVRAGVSVHRVATVIAATSLAFTLEFVWAPLVDSALTRRVWFVVGSIVMSLCLAAMFVTPWTTDAVPILIILAFASCSGAAISAVAVKGIMAYDVPAAQLGAASGFYTAGGTAAKAAGGAGTLWLLTHFPGRAAAGCFSVGAAVLAAGAITLAAPARSAPVIELGTKLVGALRELWTFVRTRKGLLSVLLCVVSFGNGTEAALIGAIAREWSVTPDQLATFALVGAAANIAGATAAGWLANRMGAWRVYVLQGWAMIGAMLVFAFAPRTPVVFFAVELPYRALATGCYATLLAIVMTSIGRGAASTKAAVLWSLTNLAFFYPTLIEGVVHDHAGTRAMLLSDAGFGVAGFTVLMAALRLGLPSPAAATATALKPSPAG